jgi:hypothetical protein
MTVPLVLNGFQIAFTGWSALGVMKMVGTLSLSLYKLGP